MIELSGSWKDPIFKYIYDHLIQLGEPHLEGFIENMQSLAQYILHLQSEFTICNSRLVPEGFTVKYSDNKIIVFSIDQSLTISGKTTGKNKVLKIFR